MAFEAKFGDRILRERFYHLRDSPSSEDKELWNLIGSWRLIYFIAREEDKQLVIIVDWLSHSDYEKLFKF